MPIVIDASVAASWALPDENHPDVAFALERVQSERGVVPALWWYEIRNILLVSERRRRLSESDTAEFLEALSDLRITQDQSAVGSRLLQLARAHKLTIYDAAYLELAKRTASPLATLDSELIRAARAEGVALVQAKIPPRRRTGR